MDFVEDRTPVCRARARDAEDESSVDEDALFGRVDPAEHFAELSSDGASDGESAWQESDEGAAEAERALRARCNPAGWAVKAMSREDAPAGVRRRRAVCGGRLACRLVRAVARVPNRVKIMKEENGLLVAVDTRNRVYLRRTAAARSPRARSVACVLDRRRGAEDAGSAGDAARAERAGFFDRAVVMEKRGVSAVCVLESGEVVAVSKGSGMVAVLHARARSVKEVDMRGLEGGFCDVQLASAGGRGSYVLQGGSTLYLVDAESHQLAAKFAVNSPVASFSVRGNTLLALGDDKSIYAFSLLPAVLREVFSLPNSYTFNRVAALGADLVAVSMNCGPLLLYDGKFNLLKQFPNLTTGVSSVYYSGAHALVSYCSDAARNAVRIVDCRSLSVVSNFPGEGMGVGFVSALCFSGDSLYIAEGRSISVLEIEAPGNRAAAARPQ